MGRLVEGFPALVPVPRRAVVTSSAVQPGADGTLTISVTGRSTASTRALVRFYRKALNRAGFRYARGHVLARGTAGTAFSRSGGAELLTVAVVDDGATRSFSVGGTVTP